MIDTFVKDCLSVLDIYFNVDMGATVQRLDYNSVKSQNFNQGLLLDVEDVSQQNIASQTYCFYCCLGSFVFLFPIVLHQLCLLHQLGAQSRE